MADVHLTIDALNKLFQLLTLTILGLDGLIAPWEAYIADPEAWVDPIPPNPYEKVRISWNVGGAPGFKVTDDVAFIRVFEVDDQYNRQHDIEKSQIDADNVNFAVSATRVNAVHWVFYGPNSYQNVQAIKRQVFRQTHHDTLAVKNVYLINDVKAPIRAPEHFASQWWERVDLTIYFNELVTFNTSVSSIVEVPMVTTFESGVEVTDSIT